MLRTLVFLCLPAAVGLHGQTSPPTRNDSLVGCYKLLDSHGGAVFTGAGFHGPAVRLDTIRTSQVSKRASNPNARVFWAAESKPNPSHFRLSFFVPYWYTLGDTLYLVQSDGFTGVVVRLSGNAQRLTGTREIFTDAVSPKPLPPQSVSAERITCPRLK